MIPLEDMPKFRAVIPALRVPLQQFMAKWGNCEKCSFGQLGGKKVHFRGYVNARVLFIGEAPGLSEHSSGLPFVGPAGEALDRIIVDAANKSGTDFTWCITNTVLCTPFDDEYELATPKLAQLGPCSFRLMEFIDLVRPELIVKVGLVAGRQIPEAVKYKGGSAKSVMIYHPSWCLHQNDQEFAEKKVMFDLSKHLKEFFYGPTPTDETPCP